MTVNDTEQVIGEKLSRRLGDDAAVVNEQYAECRKWMTTRGKNHAKYVGLSESHADNLLSRLDQIHRFVIDYLNPDDTVVITPDEADEVLLLLARDEITQENGETYAEGAKRKFSNALSKYLEWRYREGPVPFQWQPRIKFSDNKHEQTKAATFSVEELGQLFDAAEEYKSLPSYYDASEEQQDQIDALVAQRLSIPKDQVATEDRLKADFSTKLYSLISVAYDAGMLPKEIGNAVVDWYKPHEQVLVIPHAAAAKERDEEVVVLSDEAAEALSKWIRERRHLEKYDGRDELWLNREGNPYSSGSLNHMLRQLCDEAGIVKESAPIRWYSLRRSMIRDMKTDGSLEEAGDQARHANLSTTQNEYPNTRREMRRNTLNDIRKDADQAAQDDHATSEEDATPQDDDDDEPEGTTASA